MGQPWLLKSSLLKDGVHPKIISERLGHSNIELPLMPIVISC
jgi:hypothetical protein